MGGALPRVGFIELTPERWLRACSQVRPSSEILRVQRSLRLSPLFRSSLENKSALSVRAKGRATHLSCRVVLPSCSSAQP